MQTTNQEEWDKCKQINSDPYGSCTVRYTERWADLMETKLAEGAKLQDIAEATSHEADTEGITGFMYGCAVSILAKLWIHGEALRRWHNKEIQIGTEGDAANEKGTVLNPALLCMTAK